MRPSTAPDFLLSRAHGSVRTQGSRHTFTDPEEAIAALRSGAADMVVGALPFSRDDVAALTVPESIVRDDGPLEPPAYYRSGAPHARIAGLDPDMHEHLRRVEAAVATIKHSKLNKVVLARAMDIEFDPPVDPLLLAARLIDRSYHRDGFVADLSPAGGIHAGATLVGSSPEVLVKKQGSTVSAIPLAGSAARDPDPARDAAIAAGLHRSRKDHAEHQFVVDHLGQKLRPLCSQLAVPNRPQLTRTSEIWHLATPIRGTLRRDLSALELALALHPTPAICGTPADAAEDVIGTVESDRGFYAGAVGWCDSSGDGEYMVAIRCAEVFAGGRRARAWAGGGIVADSDPAAELDETTTKLRTIMRSLGLE